MISIPLDTVSPAIAGMTNVLIAAEAASAIIDGDRSVKFVSDELKKIVGEIQTVRQLEQAVGIHLGDFARPSSTAVAVRERKMLVSLVPFAGGAVIVLRPVFEEPPQISDVPRVVDVIRSVTNRFIAFAEMKSIELEVSVPDFDGRFRHHDKLADALGILLDNSLHYVPAGGQVVIGLKPMEHNGKPILLFFVMDNGPIVPEHMRQVIFESGFIWNERASERTGRGLSKVREFAAAHGGMAWVDSKTHKACSFFLRLAPD